MDIAGEAALSARIAALRPVVRATAWQLWGSGGSNDADVSRAQPGPRFLRRLDKLDGSTDDVVAFGVLRVLPKLQARHVCRLRTAEGLSAPQTVPSKAGCFTLEDETAILSLLNPEQTGGCELTPGVVMGVRGSLNVAHRSLCVSDVVFPGGANLAPASPLQTVPLFIFEESEVHQERHLLAFTSGLRLGGAQMRCAELGLMRDFLLGIVGAPEDRACAKRIGKLLVAGGLHADSDAVGGEPSTVPGAKRRHIGAGSATAAPVVVGQPLVGPAAQAADTADLFLAPLAASGLVVAVQPGEGDCGSSSGLPQPPFARALFPRCRTTLRLELLPNPCDRQVSVRNWHSAGGASAVTRVVGTNGRPVSAMLRFSPPGRSELDALHVCWHARHLAPLWPEMSGAGLFETKTEENREAGVPGDPFVLLLDDVAAKQSPNSNPGRVLLYAGNCAGGAAWTSWREPSEVGREVLALCIPAFYEEPTLVVVDPYHLAVRRVDFRVK